VIAEVAVAVVLVVIGGLLTGSFVRLLRTDPGFDAGRVLASIIVPTGDQYTTRESHAVLFRRILDSVKLIPGVVSAGAVDALPFSGENYGGMVALDPAEIKPGGGRLAEVDTVSEDYLQTLGIPLLEGRWFREEDTRAGSDLAIVNDVAAARLWPQQSAIGKRICVNCGDGTTSQNVPRWRQVIGVVGSIRHASLGDPANLEVYISNSFSAPQFLVVRTSGPMGADLAQAVRRVVAGVDPKQPVYLSATMSSLIADSVADRRFIMTLLAITGCLALLLATAGVYGVVSYVTSRRTQEIGVRMALGASPGQVQSLVFRQGIAMSAIGVVIGCFLALLLERVLSGALAGLSFADPKLGVLGVAVVMLAASVACLIPARRATRIDPISALRQD
jgi:predicted permease